MYFHFEQIFGVFNNAFESTIYLLIFLQLDRCDRKGKSNL